MRSNKNIPVTDSAAFSCLLPLSFYTFCLRKNLYAYIFNTDSASTEGLKQDLEKILAKRNVRTKDVVLMTAESNTVFVQPQKSRYFTVEVA